MNYRSQNFNLALNPGGSVFLFGVPTSVALAATPTGAVRTNGVVTFTTGVAHNFAPGMLLTAQGVSSVLGTQFGGLYVILTVPSATTVTAQPLTQGPNAFTPPASYAVGNENQPNDTGGGGSVNSIAGEQPAAPQASISVALAEQNGQTNPDLSLEVYFTGAPGAFEVDLQDSDTDTDNAYVLSTAGNKITTVNAGNWGRLDVTNVVGKFARALLVSRTNAVGMIAVLSR